MKQHIVVLEVMGMDRPYAQVLGWVVVERNEVYQHDPHDGTIHEASICRDYIFNESAST